LDMLAACDGGERLGGRGQYETASRGEMRSDGEVQLYKEIQPAQTMKDKAREWQRQIRAETRHIDRDIQKVHQEEAKLKREIAAMAKRGQEDGVRTLAKQIVRSRKTVAMLEKTKCSMTAMNLQLTTAIASFTTASSLKLSASLMKEMNQLTNVPELHKTMEEMRTEMARAEIADEIMEECLEQSDEEDMADSEVAKVYEELALDASQLLNSAGGPTPIAAALPTGAARPARPDPLSQRLQGLHE